MANANYVYRSKFKAGSRVRIASRELLESFMRTWGYHHKLLPEQLAFGGRTAEVERVSFYHGGDVAGSSNAFSILWHLGKVKLHYGIQINACTTRDTNLYHVPPE
ncbi:MAG: hypothetical protein ACRD22_15325, partial [Terriglobia bacterium]